MPLPPVNRRAALAAMMLAALWGAVLAPPAAAQRRVPDKDAAALIHDRCVAFARAHPKEGLEKAKIWRDQGGGFDADHCIAMALYALKDYRGAARQFEELATAMLGMPGVQRAKALDQAGQSWLMIDQSAHAKADFDAAIALGGDNADLLIDRAEAYAGLKQYWDAIDDLNRAVEIAPKRADVYIYRGSAYRYVGALDLALEDVERGLSLSPDNVMGLLERGNLRRLKGDAAGARKDWQRVAELSPDTPAGQAAKANLAKLGTAGAESPAHREKKKPR